MKGTGKKTCVTNRKKNKKKKDEFSTLKLKKESDLFFPFTNLSPHVLGAAARKGLGSKWILTSGT